MSRFSLDVLNRRVFAHTLSEDPDVILGAVFGEDAALTRAAGGDHGRCAPPYSSIPCAVATLPVTNCLFLPVKLVEHRDSACLATSSGSS
jgi:hypothetical protein